MYKTLGYAISTGRGNGCAIPPGTRSTAARKF
jgi:hypothetical protein